MSAAHEISLSTQVSLKSELYEETSLVGVAHCASVAVMCVTIIPRLANLTYPAVLSRPTVQLLDHGRIPNHDP